MKFHVIAGILLCISGYLVYALLFGFHSDLETARVKIQVESVKSLRDEKKVQSNDKYAGYINSSLVQKAPTPKTEVPMPKAAEETSVVEPVKHEERYQGEKTYWCKPVAVRLERNPVKCLYPDSCFGCEGPIIRPEYEGAVPLCANGQQSRLYHVECCPNFGAGEAHCPSANDCFEADNVPSTFCTCNSRPECRLVDIAGSIQCACIDR